MKQWVFDETLVEERDFELLPVGEHRVRIADVVPEVGKNSGRDMFKMIFDVSGHSGKLFHYLVFMDDKPEITNTNLAQIFDSFGITKGDMNLQNWIGKVGAAKIKHDSNPDYNNGEPSAKINYFIKRDKQANLPEWVEKGKAYSSRPAQKTNVTDDDLPF